MELTLDSLRLAMQEQIEESKFRFQKAMDDAFESLREKLGLKPTSYETEIATLPSRQDLIEDENTELAYEKSFKDTLESLEVVMQSAESGCLDIYVQCYKDPREDYRRRIELFDLLLEKQQYLNIEGRMKAIQRKQNQMKKLKKQQRKFYVNFKGSRGKQGVRQNVQMVFEEGEKGIVILKILVRQESRYVFQFDTKD